MSNLQCPVTVLLVPPRDALRPARRLRGERVATIWCNPHSPAMHAAAVLAAELGVPVRRAQGATPDELESVADEFRGETVLGIVPEPVLLELLGQLFPGQHHSGPEPGASYRLSYDGEAWTISP